MEIKIVLYNEVEKVFGDLKPDLLDKNAVYHGALIDGKLIGIVSYVEHPATVYLCHAYVIDEYRNRGIYKLLWDYRDTIVKDIKKPITAHCNVDSLKNFINNGYVIEKALFKVVKN
jgi:hypothetical protein